MNVLIYSRVSTITQSNNRQISDLQKIAEEREWNVVEVVSDVISGTSEISSRTSNMSILPMIKSGHLNKVLITEISRLGRKVSDAISFIELLNEHGVSLYIQNLGMETLRDDGKVNLMFKPILVTLASFAEMERELLSERIRSGLANARAKGKVIGRPRGYRKRKIDYQSEYRELIKDFDKGLSLRKLSRIHGVSVNTIRKVKEMVM